MNYKPVKDGIDKTEKSVIYHEENPPTHLKEFVHCFWELKTTTRLSSDFQYHIVPDACVNILFDQLNVKVAAITAIQKTSITLNLGKNFHFIGAQLLPGVWNGNPEDIKDGLVNSEYRGKLNLPEVNSELIKCNFLEKQTVLTKMIEAFISKKLIITNPITAKILANLETLASVSEMAKITHLSPRQLQRNLKKTTGFSPHDFLKVLRVQQSFQKDYLSYYADQAHFIHSFRTVTGYTPHKYKNKFNV